MDTIRDLYKKVRSLCTFAERHLAGGIGGQCEANILKHLHLNPCNIYDEKNVKYKYKKTFFKYMKKKINRFSFHLC